MYKSNPKWKILKIVKKIFFCNFFENYALVCKEYACHILFSYIIMKLRHETNCWSLFWVYKFNQKWKNLKIQKIGWRSTLRNHWLYRPAPRTSVFKIFFVFLKFFTSDRIYTPKIMTNKLSHVLSSWLYTKKVCDMHTFCTPRPTKATLCS